MNVADILDELNIQVHAESEEWYTIDCPFCGKSGKPGMGIARNGRSAHCWKCGTHWIAEVLANSADVQIAEIVPLLKKIHDGLPLPVLKKKGKLVIPRGVGPLQKPHQDYLRQRGINPEDAVKYWNVRGIGIAPKYPWSLFIPISYDRETVSWTTRRLTDTNPRYRSASSKEEAIPHKSLLLGEEWCWHTILVVEGPLSAMIAGPGSAATFGTSWTQAQLARISRFPVRVICFDAEEEAQQAARRLCRELKIFPGKTSNVVLDTGKDPGEIDCKELKRLRRLFLER